MNNPDSFNPKWEVGNVDPVTLPEETFGWCLKKGCKTPEATWLANGICQKCWDKGVSRIGKNHSVLPTIDLSFLPPLTEKMGVDKFQEKP